MYQEGGALHLNKENFLSQLSLLFIAVLLITIGTIYLYKFSFKMAKNKLLIVKLIAILLMLVIPFANSDFQTIYNLKNHF